MNATAFRACLLIALAFVRPAAPVWRARRRSRRSGPVWPKLSAAERDQVLRFGDDFKQFMGRAKSAQTFVREARALVEAAGFKPWPASPTRADVAPGSRWYAVNRDRTIVAFVIGTDPLSAGARIVNTHNDSVHLDAQAEAVPRELRHRAARHGRARRHEELPVGQPAAGADRPGDQGRRHGRRRSTSATRPAIRC